MSGQRYIWGTDDLYDMIHSDFGRPLKSAPLTTRGWAVQERVLPRRTLYFARGEVFLECDKSIVCEAFPIKIPDQLAYFLILTKRPICAKTWIEIVEKYSKCKLTLSRYKLVAISGLARLMATETGDEYVAGMWRKDLERQLCWRALGEESHGGPYMSPPISTFRSLLEPSSLDANTSSNQYFNAREVRNWTRTRSWHNRLMESLPVYVKGLRPGDLDEGQHKSVFVARILHMETSVSALILEPASNDIRGQYKRIVIVYFDASI